MQRTPQKRASDTIDGHMPCRLRLDRNTVAHFHFILILCRSRVFFPRIMGAAEDNLRSLFLTIFLNRTSFIMEVLCTQMCATASLYLGRGGHLMFNSLLALCCLSQASYSSRSPRLSIFLPFRTLGQRQRAGAHGAKKEKKCCDRSSLLFIVFLTPKHKSHVSRSRFPFVVL